MEEYRGKGARADCILGYSGGRDSSYVLVKLAKDYSMKVLLATYDWGMLSREAQQNWELAKSKLGVEHVVIRPDIERIYRNIRLNIQAWLKKPHLGMVWLFTQGDKLADSEIEKLAEENDIPLVVSAGGNYYESTVFKTAFMGGKVVFGEGAWRLSPSARANLALHYVFEYFRNPSYFNVSFFDTIRSFAYYYLKNVHAKNKQRAMKTCWVRYFRYFIWDEEEVLETIRRELDWESPPDTSLTWRTDDCTAPFYNYIHHTVAGFTENDTFRSNQVRAGVLSREEALQIVKEENKPRLEAMRDYLESLGLDYEEIKAKIDAIPELYGTQG